MRTGIGSGAPGIPKAAAVVHVNCLPTSLTDGVNTRLVAPDTVAPSRAHVTPVLLGGFPTQAAQRSPVHCCGRPASNEPVMTGGSRATDVPLVILPIRLPKYSVNHRFASGPVVIPNGIAPAVSPV